MTLTKVAKQNGFTTWTVATNGTVIGLIVKDTSSRTPQPWKAYKGIGATAVMVGAFFDYQGGKSAALAAIQA